MIDERSVINGWMSLEDSEPVPADSVYWNLEKNDLIQLLETEQDDGTLLQVMIKRVKRVKTAQQVWDEAEEGQAFACQFRPVIPEIPLDEEPEVVWVKGVVDDLVWSNVLWITPITYGERAYLK